MLREEGLKLSKSPLVVGPEKRWEESIYFGHPTTQVKASGMGQHLMGQHLIEFKGNHVRMCVGGGYLKLVLCFKVGVYGSPRDRCSLVEMGWGIMPSGWGSARYATRVGTPIIDGDRFELRDLFAYATRVGAAVVESDPNTYETIPDWHPICDSTTEHDPDDSPEGSDAWELGREQGAAYDGVGQGANDDGPTSYSNHCAACKGKQNLHN